MKKKLMALLLAIVMVTSLLQTVALAEGDSWSYDASEKTFTVNCTIPEQATAGGTIPEAVFFSAKQENKDIVFGAGWGKAVDPQTPVAFEYNSKHWCDPRNIEETSFASGSEYGYLILIAYDPKKFGDLSDATVLVNGKEYDVGVVYPYDKPISSTMLESGAKIAGVFLAIDFGTLSSGGEFSGGDFAEASTNKSGDTTITATKAAPFKYDIVIPESVTGITAAGVYEVGQAKVANVKNATDNTVISYTAATTAFKCEGKTDIPASYYTDEAGQNDFPTTAVKVYEKKAEAARLPTMWVKIADSDWNDAEAGTYTATVTFNFEAEEAEAKTVTAADALTTDAIYNLKFNYFDNENTSYSFTYKKTVGEFEVVEILQDGEDVVETYGLLCPSEVDGTKIIFKLGNNLQFTLDTSTSKYEFTGTFASDTTFTSFSVKPAGASEFTEITLTEADPV